MSRPSRSEQRRDFLPDVRIRLLEHDADEHEDEMASVRKTLNWIVGLQFTLLVAITVATVMLLIGGVVEP